MKSFRITLGEKVHHVTVEILGGDPAPVVASAPAPAAPAPAAPAAPAHAPRSPAPGGGGRAGEVRSPLAGKLVSLDVKAGQPVEEGAQVATIEAMKMNTYVFAPKSGVVAALGATPGAAVDENDVLLVIE